MTSFLSNPTTTVHAAANSPAADFYARLRRPAPAASVPGSLPVLFFGDERNARAATLALNPSSHEYCAPGRPGELGPLLAGAAQRFGTLGSLGAPDRASLSDEQCDEAIRCMREYFALGRPSYGYFRHLQRFLDGVGYSYQASSAVHLDLVQEPTFPLWGRLPKAVQQQLLSADVPFLSQLIRRLRLEVIFCNGRTASDHLRDLLAARVAREGTRGRLRWWAGTAVIGSRAVRIVGWNIPLNGRTGFTMAEKETFGRMIARALEVGPA